MIGFFTGVEAFFTGLSRIHRLLPWILAYLLLLPLPFLLKFGISEYYVDLANRACLFILLSVGLNIVKGFCGQVTVGHIGLYAIGAVTSALLAINYQLPFWVSAPIAILITGLAGIIVGLPSVRLEGAYLALATLGLGESVRIMIAVTPAFGSSTGIMMIPEPKIGEFIFNSFESYYYLVMTCAIIRQSVRMRLPLRWQESMCRSTNYWPSSSAHSMQDSPEHCLPICHRDTSITTISPSSKW